jgi:hypothetical protein
LKKKKNLAFADVEDEIRAALKDHLKKADIKEELILINGFFNESVSRELTNDLVVGGPKLPIVVLVGEESGRVYLFALKALLPDKE